MPVDVHDLNFQKHIKSLIKEAANIIKTADHREVKEKTAFDFVTQYDVAVENFIREDLTANFADVHFLGEESHNQHPINGPTWILDPIDGTTNFIFDRGYSCISLAYFDGNVVSFGAIYDPYRDEYFHAVKGGGAFCNDRPIQVSPITEFKDALIIFSISSYYKAVATEQFKLMAAIHQEVIDLRVSGSAALNFTAVASGRASMYIAPYLQPWDGAAGTLLVKEAGGVVYDYYGQDNNFLHTTTTVAGPAVLANEVLAILQKKEYKELMDICRI